MTQNDEEAPVAVILMCNSDYLFQVFEIGSAVYMTVVVGGVAQYEVTIALYGEEGAAFGDDENLTIALAVDVATRSSAYEPRMVQL